MKTPKRTLRAMERQIMCNAKGTTMAVKTKKIGLLVAVGAMAALAGAPRHLEAQDAETRIGWQPYLGCWEPQISASGDWMLSSTQPDEGMLCFVPSGSDVEMLTIMEGAIAFREPFPADGQARSIEQEGCSGTEAARFSEDQRRIYTISEVSCEGDPSRRSTGIISMPGPDEWLDVRATEMNGVTTAWSQWYQRTDASVLRELGFAETDRPDPFAVRSALAYANAGISIDEVIDASRNVDAKAVEGWIAAVRQEFANLDADDLIRLEDAGVPTVVIDVVVAVSFPEQFAFGQPEAAAAEGDFGRRRAARTIYANPYGYYNDPYYRYGYRSYWGGYGGYYGGYGGYGGYGYGWGRHYVPVVVDVNRTKRSFSDGGRVVAGRGYRGPRSVSGGGYSGSGGSWVGSSGGSRGSASSGGSSGGTRTAKPRGGSSSSISSSGGPTRSTPSTSSRSSGSTGRKAKPRGGR